MLGISSLARFPSTSSVVPRHNLETFIKEFCISNAGKKEIDFFPLKDSEHLRQKYTPQYSLNQFKGEILELLLEELFLGNGYRVERLGEGGKDEGCDLLIRYSHDNSIRFVLQAKNWGKNIDKPTIQVEYLKFTDNYQQKYNLNPTHFCFVSWNYVKEVKDYLTGNLNIKIWNENDIVQKLFKNYQPKHPKNPSILLEPYQETAFNNVLEYWDKNQKCYIEHATGTGKTYIIAKLAQYLLETSKNKILILSPSVYINSRIETLLSEFIPSKEISRTLKEDKPIHLLTYSYVMHNAEKNGLKGKFSHIIMDETHRAGAPEWYSRGILNTIDKNTKVVGLSATMQRYTDGTDIKNFLDDNCAGKINLFEAMARGILPTGSYVYSVLDMKSKVNELAEEIYNKYERDKEKRNELIEKLNAQEISQYDIQKIIYKYYNSLKYRKIIAFCEDIGHTYDIQSLLAKTFIQFSKIKRFEVHSKYSKSENEEQLNKFSSGTPRKDEIYILTAVDMLNEGINVSGIDSVMLFRKTESPRIYLQQIGRCMRRHGIEHPLIFDCVLNYQSVNISFIKESQDATQEYQKALDDFDFRGIEAQETIHIQDESKTIAEIISEVEKRLNFYPTYEEARNATRRISINTQQEYHDHYKEDSRLPSAPERTYRNQGWTNWYDFLGKKSPDFYSTYHEAKEAVKKLGIKYPNEYRQRYSEDHKLPSVPDRVYKESGWISWSDFFGRQSRDIYLTYKEARNAVSKKGFRTVEEYRKNYGHDPRLPRNPNREYKKKGWVSWYHFINKDVPNFYSTFQEAKAATARVGIKSLEEYHKRYKEDQRLPRNPNSFYNRKGWQNWPYFFDRQPSQSSIHRTPSLYLTYEEARKAVQKIGIQSGGEYRKSYKTDPKLPANPERNYRGKGWVSWYHFLKKDLPNFYPSYEETKEAIKRLGIKSESEYRQRRREDPRLPSDLPRFYSGKGWIDWSQLFGRKSRNLLYPTYEEAKESVSKMGIRSKSEYSKRYKADSRLPSDPYEFYKNRGWVNFHHFFCRESPSFYSTYSEAREAVQKLGIKSQPEYKKRYKEDPKLNSNPNRIYKEKGWINWAHFLGQESRNLYSKYEEAKDSVKKLGINSQVEYYDRFRGDSRLPSDPYRFYKNRGWIDWYDSLGKEKKK